MASAAGLDITRKHYTNHSIRKTTVKKLKKAGVSTTEIMAITGHKNQQSLADYDEIDDDDHMRLSKILSKEKQVATLPTSSAQPVHNFSLPHDMPQSLPTYQPIFNIQQ